MFSERIRRRNELWWGRSRQRWNPSVWLNEAQRRRQKRVLRNASDPESVWQAGKYWQRTLTNKWNAREFAKKHGCQVPELYWSGTDASDIPFETLPEHFVIRPAWGSGDAGVFVVAGEHDVLHGTACSPTQLVERLEQERSGTGHVLLVEEYLKNEEGEYSLPIEYKCHMFCGEIGAIQMVDRTPGSMLESKQICYQADWTNFDEPIFAPLNPAEPADPPLCLDEIRACGGRLGGAYGTYVRVDFFATQRGCVFNEFASTPRFVEQATAFGDAYFEDLWREHCPDTV